MEIPAIIFRNSITIQTLVSKQDTCVQHHSSSSYYQWLKLDLCRKMKQLTAFQKSNTNKISTPKSFFIAQEKDYKRAFFSTRLTDRMISNDP